MGVITASRAGVGTSRHGLVNIPPVEVCSGLALMVRCTAVRLNITLVVTERPSETLNNGFAVADPIRLRRAIRCVDGIRAMGHKDVACRCVTKIGVLGRGREVKGADLIRERRAGVRSRYLGSP